MRTRVRQLDDSDLAQVVEFLATDPVAHLFLLSRLRQGGLDAGRLGCPVYGAFRGDELAGIVHVGANLVPAVAEPEVVPALASRVGRWRRSSSIMGPAESVLPLYEELCRIGSLAWGRPRETRPRQPLLAIRGEAQVGPDGRVRGVDERDFEGYFRAAVAMYTEEVGVSPLDPGGGYRRHMLSLVRQGRCFGIVEDAVVRWKSDIAVTWGEVCQVQGVWMDPQWRGRGLAAPAMAAVVELARRQHEVVSLYVNDFNTRALRTYRAVGFGQVGTMATVLY